VGGGFALVKKESMTRGLLKKACEHHEGRNRGRKSMKKGCVQEEFSNRRCRGEGETITKRERGRREDEITVETM